MCREEWITLLQDSPIVAAVKDEQGLLDCLDSECRIVFVLYGDIVGIGAVVERLKQAGKLAMVHVDLIDGLAAREVAIDFILQNTKADGILSTKPGLVRVAKARGLLTVQRFFVLDSLSLAGIAKQLPLDAADAIEILPGVMPKVIRQLAQSTQKPLIAGGLISDKEDIVAALDAGATAISSTNRAVWFM